MEHLITIKHNDNKTITSGHGLGLGLSNWMHFILSSPPLTNHNNKKLPQNDSSSFITVGFRKIFMKSFFEQRKNFKDGHRGTLRDLFLKKKSQSLVGDK